MRGRINNAGVPDDYALTTLADSPIREAQPEVYRTIDAYAATFDRQFDVDARRIKSVYLYSAEPGTGKTTTAAALLNEWLVDHFVGAAKQGEQPAQMPAFFLDVNEWQSLYNGFNRPHVPQHIATEKSTVYYRWEAKAKAAPFAVFDDIGVRDATDAFRADLHGVINYRVTNALPTVYTSNVALVGLERVFDARLADRIRDMCVEVEFTGGSRRGMR